jgi:hypothetical protein
MIHFKFGLSSLLVALVAAFALAQSASAQEPRRIEVGLLLGAYLPSLPLHDTTGGATHEWMQQSAPAVGGHISRRFGDRGGIEGTVWWAPSSVSSSSSNVSANVLAADLRGVANLIPEGRPFSFLLMGGPAVLHRGGDAYDFTTDATMFGTAFGVGLDGHWTRGLDLRAQVDCYLYQAQLFSMLGDSPPITPLESQRDFVVSVSLRM